MILRLALPVVAIIGRPNVGKSTLVNRLCKSREAIVHDEPGVTRDRTYQEGYWRDRHFKVVDTGGLVFDDDSEFLPEIREQANLALAEASVAVVIADGQQGMTAADESIAEWLRGQKVPVLLAVNKCESPEAGLAMAAEFWGLGLGEPQPISAIHGAGTGDEPAECASPRTGWSDGLPTALGYVASLATSRDGLLSGMATGPSERENSPTGQSCGPSSCEGDPTVTTGTGCSGAREAVVCGETGLNLPRSGSLPNRRQCAPGAPRPSLPLLLLAYCTGRPAEEPVRRGNRRVAAQSARRFPAWTTPRNG